jgi:hypothetical protein
LKGKLTSTNIIFVFLTTLLLMVNFNVNVSSDNDDDNNEKETDDDPEFFIMIPQEVCLTIGYSLYFTGLSMFCWMALLCFDLYWTLTHLKVLLEHKGCSKKMVILNHRFEIVYLFLVCFVPLHRCK